MVALTVDDLRRIAEDLPRKDAAALLPHITSACAEFDISTPARMAAFISQCCHETGEFKFFSEIWGPTAQQRKYEPPSDVARRLGNTTVGDGKKFRGRGPFQLSGRFNYSAYGKKLGVDLIADPALAARPDIGFRIAGLYWKDHGLNKKADDGDFVGITKAINGGLTNLADRQKYWERAKAVLGASASSA